MPNPQIYLAPMQGHTDYVYRKVYAQVFGNIEKYYTPYICFENDGSIRTSRMKEILSGNNQPVQTIPQILAGSAEEALALIRVIQQEGFSSANLNLGCPFPMVANRGKGCGLLQYPDKIKQILDALCDTSVKISVKTRTGREHHDEFEKLVPVFNAYPLDEIIIHPRLGIQQYKGEASIGEYLRYKPLLKHKVVYNGDIATGNYRHLLAGELQNEAALMIGRGILANPFLISRIQGRPAENEKETLKIFIDRLIEEYTRSLVHESHIHARMKEQFEYLSSYFPEELKIRKRVKKSRNLSEIKEALRLFL